MTEKRGIFKFFKNFNLSKEDEANRNWAIQKERAKQSPSTKNVTLLRSAGTSAISQDEQDYIQEKLSRILHLAGFECQIVFLKYDGGKLFFDIQDSDDVGRIIGKEGATLDALQVLLRRMMLKQFDKGVGIVLEAGDYRKRRLDQLRAQAEKAVNQALQKGKRVELRPMRASDRRMIHMLYENDERIRTFSKGERMYRRIVFEKKETADS